jgi:cell division protein FtsB
MLNSEKYLVLFRQKRKAIVRIIIIIVILFFMIFSDYGFLTTGTILFKINELEDKIEQEQSVHDSLLLRRRILLNDSLEIERIAREHFGLIKPGEEVYIIIKK